MRQSDSHSEAEEGEASSPEVSSPTFVSSGISALIQAATSQLGQLADVASQIPKLNEYPLRESSTVPEILMSLCSDPENLDIITFLPDGKFFAVRQAALARPLRLLQLDSFQEFLSLMENYGFSVIKRTEEICILQHPKFTAGGGRHHEIRFGETPESVRLAHLPGNFLETTKRRLSKSRRESFNSVSSKQKIEPGVATRSRSASEEDLRHLASTITQEKLKITPRPSLVEKAVTSATQEIVTDAIESLLRDEGHSHETFLKHEKELSKSSIPGVVPVCKQLFDKEERARVVTAGSTEEAEQVVVATKTDAADQENDTAAKHPPVASVQVPLASTISTSSSATTETTSTS